MSEHYKITRVADFDPAAIAVWLKAHEAAGWELYVANDQVLILARS